MTRTTIVLVLSLPLFLGCATGNAQTRPGAAGGPGVPAAAPAANVQPACVAGQSAGMPAAVENTARGADLVFKGDARALAELKPRLEAHVARHAGRPLGGPRAGRMAGRGAGMGGPWGMGMGPAGMPDADVSVVERAGELRLVHVARDPARVGELQEALALHATRMGSRGCLEPVPAPLAP